MKKTKKWMKFRHRVVRNIAYAVLKPYSRLKYGIKVERFKEQGDRQYLILINHQTAFDQFFVGMSFRGPVYYLASEDLFANGWVSSLIKYLAAPIPIRKQAADVQAVINCMRVVKEGGTIAIAPEGNRTYSGKTEYINPSIVMLVKKLGIPIALYRIEGGYGVHPRWSDKLRKGKMRSYVSRVVEPEEYNALTNDELYKLIQDKLYVNEARLDSEFLSKRSAEYLERAIYVCPDCGLSVFESHGDIIECKKCRKKVRYLKTKELSGVDCKFPFRFVSDWYDYQCGLVNALDTEKYKDKPLYDDTARFSELIPNKKRKLIRETAKITLYGNRIVIDEGKERELIFPFDELSGVTVLGRNKLNIYKHKQTYQFKGDKRFNALKYVNIFYRHRNIVKGDLNGKFLGL